MSSKRSTDTYLLQRGGQILAGRYRVTELLGVGAMGSVWMAEQMALKQPVVVKFHEEGFVGTGARAALERFMIEARTLASVRHRNVCELHEVGRTEDGEPYLVMERLRGRTLAERLREDVHLPLQEALTVAIEVSRGLEAVHAAGVLHRDVKPENIFLHETELGVVPKLIDFGLARVAGGKRITGGGSAVGTPGYMAPEQARGDQDLDRRVDLYALGVTLYEMLSGELPARGETMVDLMIWTTTELPIPLTVWRPDLAGPVADGVMKAIEPHREHRYAGARTMRKALEELAASCPSERPPARIPAPPDRHRAITLGYRGDEPEEAGWDRSPSDGVIELSPEDLEALPSTAAPPPPPSRPPPRD